MKQVLVQTALPRSVMSLVAMALIAQGCTSDRPNDTQVADSEVVFEDYGPPILPPLPGPPEMAEMIDRTLGGPVDLPSPLDECWRTWQHRSGQRPVLLGLRPGQVWPAVGDHLLELAWNIADHGISPQLLPEGLVDELESLRAWTDRWTGWTGDGLEDEEAAQTILRADRGLAHLWVSLVEQLDGDTPLPGESPLRQRQTLLDALATWNGSAQLVSTLPPPTLPYSRLQEALVAYQEIEAAGGFIALPEVFKRARPKRKHKDIPDLRRRLSQEDPLGAGEGEVWDQDLTDALKRARAAMQLRTKRGKGLIDKHLLKALGIPVEERLRSLELNLKRLRRSPLNHETYVIFVNLPDFHGEVRDGPELLHRFRVVIGNRKKEEGVLINATPKLTGRVKTIIYNPFWNVPRRIFEEELLPEAEAWVAKELEKRAANAAPSEPDGEAPGTAQALPDPTSAPAAVSEAPTPPAEAPVDGSPAETPEGAQQVGVPDYWASHGYEVMFPDNPKRMYVRGVPGPGNALGKVKFLFDNRFAIYLHDTPAKAKFRFPRRAFSHGCMRVHKPLDLAKLLLERDGSWPLVERYKVLKHRDRTQFNLKRPVPLVVEYITTRVDEDGRVHWLMDVYGRDKLQIAGK